MSAAIVTGASLAFGSAWLTALVPLARHHAGSQLPSRLVDFGLPRPLADLSAAAPLLLALPWLLRDARAGRPRLALATGLMVIASPWVLPWYAVWIVPLAAIEEDPARLGAGADGVRLPLARPHPALFARDVAAQEDDVAGRRAEPRCTARTPRPPGHGVQSSERRKPCHASNCVAEQVGADALGARAGRRATASAAPTSASRRPTPRCSASRSRAGARTRRRPRAASV